MDSIRNAFTRLYEFCTAPFVRLRDAFVKHVLRREVVIATAGAGGNVAPEAVVVGAPAVTSALRTPGLFSLAGMASGAIAGCVVVNPAIPAFFSCVYVVALIGALAGSLADLAIHRNRQSTDLVIICVADTLAAFFMAASGYGLLATLLVTAVVGATTTGGCQLLHDYVGSLRGFAEGIIRDAVRFVVIKSILDWAGGAYERGMRKLNKVTEGIVAIGVLKRGYTGARNILAKYGIVAAQETTAEATTRVARGGIYKVGRFFGNAGGAVKRGTGSLLRRVGISRAANAAMESVTAATTRPTLIRMPSSHNGAIAMIAVLVIVFSAGLYAFVRPAHLAVVKNMPVVEPPYNPAATITPQDIKATVDEVTAATNVTTTALPTESVPIVVGRAQEVYAEARRRRTPVEEILPPTNPARV